MTNIVLSPQQRIRVLDSIHAALLDACPELFDASHPNHPGGLEDLETHIDQLVAIVRGTSAVRIEPYLAQILDEICSKCAHQAASGYCALRQRDLCILYRHAEPIVRAVIAALREMSDELSRAGRRGDDES